MADDDAYEKDDDAYEIAGFSDGSREAQLGMMVGGGAAAAAVDASKPSWAAAYEASKAREVTRLAGTCAKWKMDKGFGFIARDDGNADIFVHKKDLEMDGLGGGKGRFRALLMGEAVEFDAHVRDGRLQAVRVTGPKGRALVGQPHPNDGSSDSDEEAAPAAESAAAAEGAGGPARKEPPPKPKPYTAFVPRAARKPGAAGAKPKIAPTKRPPPAAAPPPAPPPPDVD